MTDAEGARILARMRSLLLAALVLGCASQGKEAPAPAATVMAGSLPSNAPAPEPKTTPERGPAEAKPSVPGAPPAGGMNAPGGPLTAAEAAAGLSAQRGGAAGGAADGAAAGGAAGAASSASDEGPCASDADCVFTRIAPGACCPMLCAPRTVTKKAAEALDEHVRSCAAGHECPLPSCRPPRAMTTPACVQSRCVAKVRDEKGLQ